ncbi:unnamed protein product, partial [Rotaria magnacalcarata]
MDIRLQVVPLMQHVINGLLQLSTKTLLAVLGISEVPSGVRQKL